MVAASTAPALSTVCASYFYQEAEKETERKSEPRASLREPETRKGTRESCSCILRHLRALTSPEEACYRPSDTDKDVFLKSPSEASANKQALEL